MSAFPTVARSYLQLIRLPATFSAWSNILAAHWISTGGEPRWGLLGLQIAIATALYWSGMVLNDCFDLAEDRVERPDRPIPGGAVTATRAWTIGWSLMALALLLGVIAGGATLWLTLFLALAVLLYDGLLKSGPLGPMAMGTCRGLNWLMGLSAAPLGHQSFWLPIPILLYTAGVTVLSRSETKGVERERTLFATLLLGSSLLAVLVLYLTGRLVDPWVVVGTGIGAAFLVHGMHRMAAEGSASAVRSQVRRLLLAMIPLDALLLLGAEHRLAALTLLLLLLPGRLLGRRLYLT